MALWSSTTNANVLNFQVQCQLSDSAEERHIPGNVRIFEDACLLMLTRFLLFHRTVLTEERAENQREYFITRCLGLSKIRFQWQHIKWDVNYCLSKGISDVMEGYVRQFLIWLRCMAWQELFASVVLDTFWWLKCWGGIVWSKGFAFKVYCFDFSFVSRWMGKMVLV